MALIPYSHILEIIKTLNKRFLKSMNKRFKSQQSQKIIENCQIGQTKPTLYVIHSESKTVVVTHGLPNLFKQWI